MLRFLLALLALCGPTRAADLVLPPLTEGAPQAGQRARVTPPEYTGTRVHHLLALPDDWTPDWKARGKSWPVIAEYTGNYFPTSGSTGEVAGAALGYGLSRGQAIWVILPYVAKGRRQNEVTWWGDIEATVDYAKINIPRLCAEFGGNPQKILLCGFSRGAIGVSFLGLHDDEVAKLWSAFWAHDHFDGVKEWKGHAWGSPLGQYRAEAATRLRRLAGRPLLVSQAGSETQKFVQEHAPTMVTFLTVDMAALFGKFPQETGQHPHNDRWPLKDCPATTTAYRWFREQIVVDRK